jgi:hypothetical protein
MLQSEIVVAKHKCNIGLHKHKHKCAKGYKNSEFVNAKR